MMIYKQFVRIGICFTLLLVWGCMESSLPIQVRFVDISGLKQNDSVLFKQNKVGQVQKVTYTKEGDYLVDITISPDFRNTATVDSKFYIDNDPATEKRKVVIIEQESPGGTMLEKGTIVLGSVRSGLFEEIMGSLHRNANVASNELHRSLQELKNTFSQASGEMDRELEGALEALSRQFNEFSEEVKQAPDSEEVKQLEESVRQFADEFSKAQKDMRETIREEVLPQLQKELDQLRERLEGHGREAEIKEIDKMVDEMSMV